MKRLINIVSRWNKDKLYRNSIYLMISSIILTGFGFFFWTINARLFSSHDVGIATTIISAMSLVATLSSLGLGIALIRFLPTSIEKNKHINSSIVVVSIAGITLATLFIMHLGWLSPKLLFIKKNLYYGILFIIFVVLQAQSNLIDQIFIALRDTRFVVIKNTLFSIGKLVFPFFLVVFGAYGIFSSWGLSLFISIIAAMFFLAVKFRFKPRVVLYDSILKRIFRFSILNYIATILSQLPGLVLPLLITNYLTPIDTAYFYVTMMIATLIFIIPTSVANSLFAEGSYNQIDLKKSIKKSVLLISMLLLPVILLMIVFGRRLLLLFGAEYSNNGYWLLVILAVSAVPQAVRSVYSAILNVKKKIVHLIFLNLVVSFSIIALSVAFVHKGLFGIAIAWLLGQCTVFLALPLNFLRNKY
ncbi:MAG: oligosaccharide flippase family protein [Candidatus Woesearchaeota archaeon]